jgi:hypothetical protein
MNDPRNNGHPPLHIDCHCLGMTVRFRLPPRRTLTSIVQEPKVMLRRRAERMAGRPEKRSERHRVDAGYRAQEAMMKAYIIFGPYCGREIVRLRLCRMMKRGRAIVVRRRNHRQA